MSHARAVSCWLCLVVAVLPLACDDENDVNIPDPQPCDVLFQVQLRLGDRVRSPAPAGLHFGAYPIIEGQRVEAPSLEACPTVIAGQLDEACAGCNLRPDICEDLVRSIFAVPAPACSACGDGLCLTGENQENCPDDCGVSCGDGVCADEENEVSCPLDCALACGNGVCEPGETPESCSNDCQYTVGNGLCEPGETPANSPVDCQSGTCGDGYCQSYETRLRCPGDCCQPAECSRGGAVCTGSHTLGECNLKGFQNCPEIMGETSCQFGCAHGGGVLEARCRSCADVVELFSAADFDPATVGCTPGGATCELAAVDDPDALPFGPWMQHRVTQCQPLWGFEGCSFEDVLDTCDFGDVCADGACVSCEDVARSTGRYDFEGEDYIFGCTLETNPSGFGCGLQLTDPGMGLYDEVVVACEALPEQPGCTIGRVVERCGTRDVFEPGCVGGVCGSCPEQVAAATGMDRDEFLYECTVGQGTCHLSETASGKQRGALVDCQALASNPLCTYGTEVQHCGDVTLDAAPPCSGTSCTVDCEALARTDPRFDFASRDYVFGCGFDGNAGCFRDGLEDIHVGGCWGFPDVPTCSIGQVVERCGTVPDATYPSLCRYDMCIGDCVALAQADPTYDFDNESYVFHCDPQGQSVCVTGIPFGGDGREHDAIVDCESLAGYPNCTIGRVVEDCGEVGEPGGAPVCEGMTSCP